MSLSDVLKTAFGNAAGQAEQSALPDIMKGVLGTEGVQTILGKLKDAGFNSQVASWVDQNKANLPISVDQIRSALGDEHVQQIAKSLGIPIDTILAGLAAKLPEIANAAGPAVDPSASGAAARIRRHPDIGPRRCGLSAAVSRSVLARRLTP